MIKQRFEKDCFLACLAMAVGLDYDIALDFFGDELLERVKERGTYGELVTRAFNALDLWDGMDYEIVTEIAVLDGNFVRIPPSAFRAFLWGRRALVQVKSLNFKGEYHIIYWDGTALHDPSNLSTYTEWEKVEPVNAWIFNEAEK